MRTQVGACVLAFICTLTIWAERSGWVHNIPSCFFEEFYLMTRSIWVGQHKTWANDVERGINVHGVWVLEADRMDADSPWGKVTAHPFYTHKIGHLKVEKIILHCIFFIDNVTVHFILSV